MASCLKPYLTEITEYRRNGKTYREIVEELKNKYGLEVEAGNLWRWLQAERQRACKLVKELQPFASLAQMQTANKGMEAIQKKTQKKIKENISQPFWFPKEKVQEEELDLRFDDELSKYRDGPLK